MSSEPLAWAAAELTGDVWVDFARGIQIWCRRALKVNAVRRDVDPKNQYYSQYYCSLRYEIDNNICICYCLLVGIGLEAIFGLFDCWSGSCFHWTMLESKPWESGSEWVAACEVTRAKARGPWCGTAVCQRWLLVLGSILGPPLPQNWEMYRLLFFPRPA